MSRNDGKSACKGHTLKVDSQTFNTRVRSGLSKSVAEKKINIIVDWFFCTSSNGKTRNGHTRTGVRIRTILVYFDFVYSLLSALKYIYFQMFVRHPKVHDTNLDILLFLLSSSVNYVPTYLVRFLFLSMLISSSSSRIRAIIIISLSYSLVLLFEKKKMGKLKK